MTIRLSHAGLAGLAASLVAGLMLLAAVEPVEAQKGGGFQSTTRKTIKPPPGKNVRDHRQDGSKTTSTAQGGVTVTSQPRQPRCRPGFLHTCLADPKGRDHRR